MTPTLLALYLGVAGLAVGSFLGLVSVRLPAGEDVVLGRSRCRSCRRSLSWGDLIPVASYIAMRGRCRTCHASVSARYPTIEIISCGIGIAAGFLGSTVAEAMLTAILGWQLLLIAVVDLEHFWLPDRLTLPLLATGLVAAIVVQPAALSDALLGAVVGFVSLYLLALVYRKLRGREGLGGGDPFLFAAVGAWVGWADLPVVLLVACAAGLGAVALHFLAGRQLQSDSRMAFGPLLAFGTFAVWIMRL